MAAAKEYKIEDLSRFAEEAIRWLGDQTLSYYGRGKPGLKFDEELVTEAELHLREAFQTRLLTRFPDHQVFKNNQENREYSHEEKRYLWIYDAMGRAEAALITKESYQGLAAARLIIETAGGMIYKLDGKEFFLNEYLDGQKIEEHLLVTSPELFRPVRECLRENG